MSLKEYPGSIKKQDCYRIAHGGSATLWASTPEKDWLFNYAHLLHAEWNPSDLLIISFSTHQIKIAGQNLKPVVDALSNLSLAQITLKFSINEHLEVQDPVIHKIDVIKLEE